MYTVEHIAEAAHTLNKAYCEYLGDTSQVLWEEAPGWQKESAINGVQFVIDNPNVTSEDMHENWMKEKRKDGWVYGTTKEPGLKTHPCMVPYEELPKEQQFKDTLFRSIVSFGLGV